MKFVLSLWTFLVCLLCVSTLDRKRSKICYKAITCIHNAAEKCGVDGKGNYRRFFDSCDILEYNCLKGKDYSKTTKANCANLPPIEDNQIEHQDQELKNGQPESPQNVEPPVEDEVTNQQPAVNDEPQQDLQAPTEDDES